jgi:hypothetical protein
MAREGVYRTSRDPDTGWEGGGMEGRSYLRTRCCGVDVASSFSVDTEKSALAGFGKAYLFLTVPRLNTAPELPNNRQYRLVSHRCSCHASSHWGLPGVWDDWGRVVVDRVCGHVAGVRREVGVSERCLPNV